MRKNLRKYLLGDKLVIAVILLGTIIWSLTMVRSGLLYDFGMGFWGPNGHDGVWHISLANSLKEGSFEMPIFAGDSIKNYHIGYDLLLALVSSATLIPVQFLYFQILPPLTALLIGLSVTYFVYSWTKNISSVRWALFFVYFGGSFGWIVTYMRGGTIGGESTFWSQQSISTLLNPPFALSLVLMVLGIYFAYISNKKLNSFLAIMLLGLLIQVKVYAGVLSIIALFISAFYELITKKRSRLLYISLGVLAVSVAMFLPFNRNAGNLIEFRPFWFIETMMQFQDRLGWTRFGEAMIHYEQAGNLKLFPAYGVAFLVFVLGNFGLRSISLFWVIKKVRSQNISELDIFIAAVIFGGILAPTLFVQKGTPWNTIQFLYYSLFFSGIIAGVTAAGIIDKLKRAKLYIGIGIILLTVPTTIGTIPHYIPGLPPAKISNEELMALNKLSQEPDGLVLSLPYSITSEILDARAPRPLYVYESTAYVSAFSRKKVYLEDEVNLEITQYPWRERNSIVEEKLYSSADDFSSFLEKHSIRYLYFVKTESFDELARSVADVIFENNEVGVYRVY